MRWVKVSDDTDVALVQAAEALREGQLVIAPTETVYGLFADATNTQAVLGVFAAKGRRPDQPLSIAVTDLGMARSLGVRWSDQAERLAQAFWPGPLTLVLPLAANHHSSRFAVSDAIYGSETTLGIRVPAHPITTALLRHTDLPLVATSANESGKPAPATCADAVAQVGEFCAFALDSGPAEIGVASTVVAVLGEDVKVLRAGALSEDVIRGALN
jgi:L-threonylcarbamoyladenylate synthase